MDKHMTLTRSFSKHAHFVFAFWVQSLLFFLTNIVTIRQCSLGIIVKAYVFVFVVKIFPCLTINIYLEDSLDVSINRVLVKRNIVLKSWSIFVVIVNFLCHHVNGASTISSSFTETKLFKSSLGITCQISNASPCKLPITLFSCRDQPP